MPGALSSHPRCLAAAAVLFAVATVGASVAQQPKPVPAGTSATPTRPEAGETGPAAAETRPTSPQQAEDDWLVDENSGKRYRIAKVPRVENTFVWLSENRIRAALGVELQVERYDDEWFWVRDYERKRLKPRSRPEPKPEPPLPLWQPASVDALQFLPFDEGLPKRGQWRNGFDLGDINGDGHLDILFGPARKSPPEPNLFLGDGQGNWRRWSAARFQPAPYDYGDAVGADWNGDGLLDLGLGIHLRGMLVLIQEPAGTFSHWSEGIGLNDQRRGGASGFASREISAVDWNGDGRVDLMALAEGPQSPGGRSPQKVDASRGFLLYLNQGDGSWQPYSLSAGGRAEREFGKAFVRGDFDGDGAKEIVLASGLYKNRRVLLEEHREQPYLRPSELPLLQPGAQITALAAADIDRDGTDDLAIGYLVQQGDVWRTGLDILYGGAVADAWRRTTLSVEEGRVWIDALAFGDLDGEDPVDLVALTGQGGVRAYLGGKYGYRLENGDELPTEVAEGCHGTEVHIADLNGDGRGEIVAAFAGEAAGFPGIEGLHEPGCPDEGSLSVWSPRPISAAPPEAH